MPFNRQMFRCLFVFTCIVVVTGMIYYWVYKFLIDDRDIGVVDYEDIDESDMDLPVVSICIDHPFLEKNIEMRDSELNGSTYLKHLKGDIYEERFESSDYENLTLNLNDYLNKIKIDFRNGSAIYVYDLMAGHDITFNGFYYEWFLKCFGYPMDKKKYGKIKRVSYIYNGEDLVQDLPRLGQTNRISISLWIHYPGQLLLRPDNAFLGMQVGQKRVYINEIEFLQSRRKRSRKCEANWKSYDGVVLEKHIALQGCVAPYHRPFQFGRMCKNQTEIQNYYYDFQSIGERYQEKACTRISKLGVQGGNTYVGTMELVINYPSIVKTIKQSKEVDFHSLIGNIGGYIGLFLGNLS